MAGSGHIAGKGVRSKRFAKAMGISYRAAQTDDHNVIVLADGHSAVDGRAQEGVPGVQKEKS